MTIKPSGSSLTLTEIDNEFGLGTSLGVMRGVTWYLDNVTTTGTFASSNLKFSDFYSKKSGDPAGSGTTTYSTPGSFTFTVPLFRTNIVIDAWGAGGAQLADGGDTSATATGLNLNAGGGKGGGGGGRRTTSPGGIGGTATGGDINEPGEAGGTGGTNRGGNAGGQAYGGGTGGSAGADNGACGNNPGGNGTSPGGGAGGDRGVDCSKNPGWSYAGGGGGGGFVRKTLASGVLSAGSSVSVTVGAGCPDSGQGGSSGNGQVKITWS